MSAGVTFEELFDPTFLNALSRWNLHARRVSGGGRHGQRLSKDLGAGIEFNDHRPYSPGDDLRAIDWNLYRRLGKVFVRLFEEEQDLPLYLVPDVSASLFLPQGGPPAIIAALRSTLAFATVGLNHHDSAGLFTLSDQLEVIFKPRAGHAQIMTFARHLARVAEAGGRGQTRLAESLQRLALLNLRKGLLIVISDFFDPRGLDAVREALQAVRHRLVLVQLVRASDANPELQGDVRLTDCESGEVADLTLTPRVLERYKAAYSAFNDGMVEIARQRHARLLRINVEGDLIDQLSSLFEHGGFRV
ncbi:MAG: DUF58 domain-containing protein [Opitutaceae bacterium]